MNNAVRINSDPVIRCHVMGSWRINTPMRNAKTGLIAKNILALSASSFRCTTGCSVYAKPVHITDKYSRDPKEAGDWGRHGDSKSIQISNA